MRAVLMGTIISPYAAAMVVRHSGLKFGGRRPSGTAIARLFGNLLRSGVAAGAAAEISE